MLIINDNIRKVMFQNTEAKALYFGTALVWEKMLYLLKGKFAEGTPSTARWLYYNGEKHYFDLEFETEVPAVEYTSSSTTPFASDRIESLIVPNRINVQNRTSFSYIFKGCYRLKTLDLSNLNTVDVDEMNSLFEGCESLEHLDLSNFDMNAVVSINQMFYGCSSLVSVNLDGWETGSLKYMQMMFQGCSSLTTLDLSSIYVSDVVNMTSIFRNCSSLESLNINGWDLRKVSSFYQMFENCTSLTTVTGTIEGISSDIDLSYSPLTRESAMVLINGLKTVSLNQTITFKQSTYDSLSESDIALATSKGWSVAST